MIPLDDIDNVVEHNESVVTTHIPCLCGHSITVHPMTRNDYVICNDCYDSGKISLSHGCQIYKPDNLAYLQKRFEAKKCL